MVRGLAAGCVVIVAAFVAAGATASPRAGNGDIVFAATPSRTQVFSIAPDGSGLTQVTHTLGLDEPVFASWSPELRFIAYSRQGGGLEVAAADGSGQKLVDADASLDRPVWTRDGQSLVYGRGREVRVIRLDGSESRRIGAGFSPAVSPDGSAIAAADGHDLVVYGLAEGIRRVVASVAYNVAWPSWSPDGREIAFTESNPDGGNPVVHIAKADGSGDRVLARDARRGFWSPDGSRLAVLRLLRLPAGTPAAIDLVRPDGSHLSEVATNASYSLSWSPTGREIAYATSDLSGLTVVDTVTGSRRVVVTAEPTGGVTDVVWSHAGNRLLFALDEPGQCGPTVAVHVACSGFELRCS